MVLEAVEINKMTNLKLLHIDHLIVLYKIYKKEICNLNNLTYDKCQFLIKNNFVIIDNWNGVKLSEYGQEIIKREIVQLPEKPGVYWAIERQNYGIHSTFQLYTIRSGTCWVTKFDGKEIDFPEIQIWMWGNKILGSPFKEHNFHKNDILKFDGWENKYEQKIY